MRSETHFHLKHHTWIAILGDVACLLVFAIAGSRSHSEGLTLDYLLRAAGPFIVSWLLFAWLSGRFEPGALTAPSDAWRPTLEAWLPAWLLGLVLRIAVFGRGFVPAFAVVSLLFNAVLLCLWRTVLAYIEVKRASKD
jgi:hypothetical protein